MLIYDILTGMGNEANSHVAHCENTSTEDLFNDWELAMSYVHYKKVKYEQLEEVFGINMQDKKDSSTLRNWLGSYSKGL